MQNSNEPELCFFPSAGSDVDVRCTRDALMRNVQRRFSSFGRTTRYTLRLIRLVFVCHVHVSMDFQF